MYREILVPLDGSYTAEKILPWVQDYAIRTGARAHLVRVVPNAELPSEEHAQGRNRSDGLRYLDAIAAKFRGADVRTEIYLKTGTPSKTIVELAVRAHANLIAMTSRGATTLQRALLGGTAEKILRLSPIPLFIIHAGAATPKSFPIKVRKIMVPLDGSLLSEAILPAAFELARWHGGRVMLFHARTINSGTSYSERLQKLCEAFEKRGVSTTYAIGTGDAATEILSTIRKRGVEMLAMNSHGRSGFSRLLLGSVAEEVIHRARVPLHLSRHRKPVKQEWIEAPKQEPAQI